MLAESIQQEEEFDLELQVIGADASEIGDDPEDDQGRQDQVAQGRRARGSQREAAVFAGGDFAYAGHASNAADHIARWTASDPTLLSDPTGAFLQLRPDRHGCDGFFAAVLRRPRRGGHAAAAAPRRRRRAGAVCAWWVPTGTPRATPRAWTRRFAPSLATARLRRASLASWSQSSIIARSVRFGTT